MKQIRNFSLLVTLFFSHSLQAQQQLTPELLEANCVRFSLNDQGSLPQDSWAQWQEWISGNQFVGLAEVHNSAQLSYFTKALLPVLREDGFQHFALEIGPHSASILEDISAIPAEVGSNIRAYNRMYGNKRKTPFVFVDKQEDIAFVEQAALLDFKFWGLDQEFAFSYEMHLDNLQNLISQPSNELKKAYQDAKELVRKNILKRKVNGEPTYCWYLSDPVIAKYFEQLENEPKAQKVIEDLKESWDIYCKSATGQGSNQQRANYMKANFESYYKDTEQKRPKVFLKLGGVHLTHGRSQFRVEDIGKFLTDRVANEEQGFLSIRHLIAYRNGKSNVGKKGWLGTSLFLEIGSKEQWTAVDLRPFRKMLEAGTLQTSEGIAFELRSYDILLISPDDQYPKVNY